MFLGSLLLAVTIVAHDPGYHTSLAEHIQRWLKSESIAATVVKPAQMAGALQKEKLAFLVGFNEPTAGELATLKAYRARGGKLVVFHSASPQLGAMMGVKPLGYTTAPKPGHWSKMVFLPNQPAGYPSAILQTSSVLQRATPIAGQARTIAVWYDRAGKPTGDAAWMASSAGWWMTHVLSADGDEAAKIRFLAAIVGQVEPAKWSYAAYQARQKTKDAGLVAYAKAQARVPGEIHAVWDHSGCGLYPGDWPRTMRFLQNAHVTDLFVNVAGAGFAHYPSAVLPRSKTYETEGDQLAACLAAARGTGIRVHAWVLCFNCTRSTPDRLEAFRKKGWRLKTPEGKLTEYLDPSIPAVRQHILAAVDEIQAKYPSVSGIHLDFVRWYERGAKPKNAAGVISAFVAEARRHVSRPRWLTTAVLGKYPSCIASVGQDWVGWLDMNAVDYVVPMDYTEDNLKFSAYLLQHALVKSHARRTIVGIGVTANESRLDARKVMEQVNLVRRFGLAGEALFDLDTTLERSIIPYLRMGQW